METRKYAKWVLQAHENHPSIESQAHDNGFTVEFSDDLTVKEAMEFIRYAQKAGFKHTHRTIGDGYEFEYQGDN